MFCWIIMVLGLASREEGAKLTEKDISKAYKLKALEFHPDKRPDDPRAHENFQKLLTSYCVLKDEKERNLFDDILSAREENIRHQSCVIEEEIQRQPFKETKRRKMMSDLFNQARVEEIIARRFKEEVDAIKAKFSCHAYDVFPISPIHEVTRSSSKDGSISVESADKDTNSAFVAMASKDAVVAATKMVLMGYFSNPLSVFTTRSVQETVDEDSVQEKLRKAHQRQSG